MITNNKFHPVSYKLPIDALVAHRNRLTSWLNNEIDECQGMGFEPAFFGPVGSGKTFALLALRDARPSEYVDWQEFLADVRIHYGMQTEDAQYFDPIRWASAYAGALLIDDVGSERDPNGHDIAAFDRIVRARAAIGSPLSFTTNLSIDELQARYGVALTSRLGRMCHFIEMTGGDRRQERA